MLPVTQSSRLLINQLLPAATTALNAGVTSSSLKALRHTSATEHTPLSPSKLKTVTRERSISPSRFQRQTSTLTIQNTNPIAIPAHRSKAPNPTTNPELPSAVIDDDNYIAPDSIDVKDVLQRPKGRRTSAEALAGLIDPHSNDHLPKLNVLRFMNDGPLVSYSYQRKIKTQRLSRYMELLTPQHEANREPQTLDKNGGKPLALVYPWLMSNPKHVEKYTRLYTDLGVDVLKISITPHDLLRPVPRAHVAAIEVLDYLLENKGFDKLVMHGLSVGAYAFMEVMTKMEENEDKYLVIRPRFIGQIWDSPCDLPGLKEGVSRSISHNRNIQVKIMQFLDWFLKVRYEAATRHYIKTQDMYYKNYLKASSLFLYSRADQVASPNIVTDLANGYYDMGYEVFSHVFKSSPHVGHYPLYRVEYKANVMAFLHHIGFLRHAGINIQ